MGVEGWHRNVSPALISELGRRWPLAQPVQGQEHVQEDARKQNDGCKPLWECDLGDLTRWGKERTVAIRCWVRALTDEALGSRFASLFAGLAEKPAACLNLKLGQQNA